MALPGDIGSMEAVIESMDETRAVIRTADQQRMSWPVKGLPAGSAVGMTVRVSVVDPETDIGERRKRAHEFINAILRA